MVGRFEIGLTHACITPRSTHGHCVRPACPHGQAFHEHLASRRSACPTRFVPAFDAYLRGANLVARCERERMLHAAYGVHAPAEPGRLIDRLG
jgi:hypothetical protein